MENKLKHCPFCGGELLNLWQCSITEELDKYKGLVCLHCEVVMKSNTEQNAIEAWNRRVDDER